MKRHLPFGMSPKVSTRFRRTGDVNPYGVAVVPRITGKLVRDHVLVSNFNANSILQANLQGTGTTIVDVAPSGTVTVFAQISAEGIARELPRGHRPDDRAHSIAFRLGDYGQPAHDGWHVGHRKGRLFAGVE
jgi:hypothetical protein